MSEEREFFCDRCGENHIGHCPYDTYQETIEELRARAEAAEKEMETVQNLCEVVLEKGNEWRSRAEVAEAKVAELGEERSFDKYLMDSLKDNPVLQESYAKAMTDQSDYLMVIESLQSRVAELEAEREWIPVTERLPEDFQDVLVLVGVRRTLYIMYRQSNGWWKDGYPYDADVTHWMPLPRLPQEDAK